MLIQRPFWRAANVWKVESGKASFNSVHALGDLARCVRTVRV